MYMLLVFIFVMYSCKKETSSVTACHCTLNKGIVFQEDFDPIPTDWTYYDTDTVSSTVVKFIAPDAAAFSYTWTIDSATYHASEVRLNFPMDYLLTNRKLLVKLSIKYKTGAAEDTVKSFERMLTFFNPCASKFNGTFIGKTDNGNTTDSFKIVTCSGDWLHPGYNFYLENFQQHCGRYFDEHPDSYNIGYKQILFSATGDFVCNSPSGMITVDGDSICMRYRSFDNGLLEAPLDHVFKGVKK